MKVIKVNKTYACIMEMKEIIKAGDTLQILVRSEARSGCSNVVSIYHFGDGGKRTLLNDYFIRLKLGNFALTGLRIKDSGVDTVKALSEMLFPGNPIGISSEFL